MTQNPSAPLSGVTILDLTHMLSGPYGTMLLADLGARTIKVEPPGLGERTRELLRDDPEYSRGGMGAYYLTLNRNKESVALDLKKPQGHAVFMDLVANADVVFDNFAAGVTTRLGIDHAALAKRNPRIITCSVTGFGETGPHPNRPAFDQVVQAMGGGMSITGQPGQPPTRSGIPIGDLGGGLFGAIGVLAALQARGTTQTGRHVDISMLDAQISLLNYMATMHLMSGHVPHAIGNGHFVHVPYNTYRTADGHIIITCLGDAFFRRLLDVLDAPGLRHPDFASQPGRFAARERIDEIVNAELSTNTTAYWLERLGEARIPCGPVNNFAQALADPQVVARGMVAHVQLKSGETLRMPGNPVKFSDATADDWATSYACPPALGEDTDRVLQSLLGYDDARIARLRKDEVVA